MRSFIHVAISLLAGLGGGILSNAILGSRQSTQPQKVLRAQSFEVVDQGGNAVAFWGVDQGHQVVLAFGGRGHAPDEAARTLPGGLENPANQLAAFGLQGNDSPIMRMSGADGRSRLRMYLSQDSKPILLMEDQQGPRLSLGVDSSDTPSPGDGDWTLTFLPDRVRIGTFTEKAGGLTYVRGYFIVNKDPVRYP
jgi:hypothetical protein